MDISKHSFVTVNEILSDVLKQVDDERYEINSRGYYISLVQQALEGLAFDTFFDIKHEDFEFPKDELRLEMPIGSFNVRHIYIYNGDKCVISNAQKVWWKRHYYPAKKGNGYFADNRGNNSRDPFFPSNNFNVRDANGLIISPSQQSTVDHSYYYNIQNGEIMFSSACRTFSKVHVEFNGTGCEIGDLPIIPMFLREAVQDFTTEATLRIRMARPDGKQWGGLWQIYAKRLNRDTEYGLGTGSWQRASYRVKTLSASKRADFGEYYGRWAYEAGL
jgi:hypothetical protein